MNGQPGVNIGVYLQTGANAMAAASVVKARITELAQQFPKGHLDYTITNDTTVFVGASLNEVYRTLMALRLFAQYAHALCHDACYRHCG